MLHDREMKDEALAIFAKMHLLGNTQEAAADKILLEHIMSIGGSFYTKIIDAMWSAHYFYKERLVLAFPELESVFRYMTEEGYWDKFKEKYSSVLEHNKTII